MNNKAPILRNSLPASAMVMAFAAALTGCGGAGESTDAAAPASTATVMLQAKPAQSLVIPHNASFRGKTYAEWEVAFWQWALALPLSNPPHPFQDCKNRPISAGQTGNVWFWSAPDAVDLGCDQSATVIPLGTAIFLTMLDVEASSLDAPPFQSTTADGQRAIAQFFADHIQDLFCTIDDVPVENITAFRTLTNQFPFSAPSPWIFEPTGGNGTAVGDGYFLMLTQLPPGKHKIHYGGKFHFNAGEIDTGPVDIPKDVTLTITVGAA